MHAKILFAFRFEFVKPVKLRNELNVSMCNVKEGLDGIAIAVSFDLLSVCLFF